VRKFAKASQASEIILYSLSNIFITRHCKLIFVIHICDNICIKNVCIRNQAVPEDGCNYLQLLTIATL